jgi:hypothetical protein
LEDYLPEVFGQQPLDAILDCVGSQALYTHSPRYLKPNGKFINIVGGWSQGVIPFIRNKLRPYFLGGTPRSYELFLLNASGKTAREVAAWVEQGVIKQPVIDSEFPMEQAVEVCISPWASLVFPLTSPGLRETRNRQGKRKDCCQGREQLIPSSNCRVFGTRGLSHHV